MGCREYDAWDGSEAVASPVSLVVMMRLGAGAGEEIEASEKPSSPLLHVPLSICHRSQGLSYPRGGLAI